MTTINLRDFYPWYTQDEFVEVPDEIADELLADKRYQKAHRRRTYRNKAQYSLDAGDGIGDEACFVAPSPYEIYEYRLMRCQLCNALNSLPETQSQRIKARFILDKSITDIARAEGVAKSRISESIGRGLRNIIKYLENTF